MAFTVRRAEQRDLESLGRLGAMLVQVHYAFDPQRFIAPIKGIEHGYASFLGSRLGSSDDCIFVAEQNGAVIGYVFAAIVIGTAAWRERARPRPRRRPAQGQAPPG